MAIDWSVWLDSGPLMGEEWSINQAKQQGRRGWQSALRAFGYQAERRRDPRRSIWQHPSGEVSLRATEMVATRW